MSKIFINYRREDSSAYAGRLYDRLASHFGRDHVFMDIDQIAPGEDFIEVIQEKLSSVQIAIVMIGKHWFEVTDDAGQRRLDNPDDFVRLEIAELLARKIRVIPVLVGGAIVPKSSQLPECLAPLVRRNAYEISDNRFHSDVDKLIQALEKIIGAQMPPQPTESPKIPDPQMPAPASQRNSSEQTNANADNIVTTSPDQPNSSRPTIILGTMAILVLAVIVFYYSPWTAQETGAYLSQPVASESKESVAKQSTVEQPSETSSSLKKKVIAEQPNETPPLLTKTTELLIDQSSEALLKKKPVVEQPSETRLPFEPEMVRIPPGKFLMGSPKNELGRNSNENPQHEVTIAYAFEISKYEVTGDEYDAFAQATNRKLLELSRGRGKWPVKATFNDAQAYVQWLSQQTGKKYRLPTEAEWEYAARAGTQTAYWWGNDIGKNNAVCNGCDSQGDDKFGAPVGSLQPNAFGLYDTAGNVPEWTQDCWHYDYLNAPNDGSAWLVENGGDCTARVVRGGDGWDSDPKYLRSAFRRSEISNSVYSNAGVRIARVF